ncbi:uncharacterized protein LOC122643506 [Telopea speciosissima]|uniref:uncharacterized protein LOC122643506 n=1 Tax=Telopea speciosissima TaxID=54955 RepID=UPI001CC7939C|nr:uncharacterized protein LOC122643506 [Telopea speciosissima]
MQREHRESQNEQRIFMQNVTAQLQNVGWAGPIISPRVHKVPNPTANTILIIPPFGPVANEVPTVQVNQNPPPPPLAALPVRNVIRDLERIFKVLPYSDLEKIRCATFQLRGDADVWWHSSKDLFWVKYPNATWAQFKEAFLENYFPRNFREKKEIEFMSLSQGSKLVLEYQQIFEEYFYFASTHLKTEDVKVRRFEGGLRASLSTSVVLHKYPTYAKVVEAAKMIEDQQRENYQAIQASKRPMPSHDSKGPNKFQRRGPYTNAAPIQSRRPDAAQAPKAIPASHYGAQTLICYNYKESGYMVKDCPQP